MSDGFLDQLGPADKAGGIDGDGPFIIFRSVSKYYEFRNGIIDNGAVQNNHDHGAQNLQNHESSLSRPTSSPIR
ncbi:hypothetical protein MKY48_16810 [Paenibacillus sp. FSL W8-0187]|uniref:Uncharacterized protein n=1 Tax=Paenibacillus lautus TaxID=1401 RepID=A0A1R1B1D8_PAELA|nr:hypothetical protein [Paenibacillus lautus]OME92335.1 hypothetical protein BK123_17205 [Paenibacillus lautus]